MRAVFVLILTMFQVVNLGEEAHLNTSFKHFIYFVQVKVRTASLMRIGVRFG